MRRHHLTVFQLEQLERRDARILATEHVEYAARDGLIWHLLDQGEMVPDWASKFRFVEAVLGEQR